MLDESVRMQLVSDVPVGVFLSGGIDSSSVVSILSRTDVRPSTFSIVFPESDYSEAESSRAVAHQFHTDHHEITVSQSDFQAAVAPAIDAMDLPTIDGINTYFVSQQARAAGVKVVLSGLGGDEMFAGYPTFRTVPRMERFANAWKLVPDAVARPLAGAFERMSRSSDKNRKLSALGRSDGEVVHPYFLARMLFTPDQQNELLPSESPDSTAFSREKPLAEVKPSFETGCGEPRFLLGSAVLHAQHALERLGFHEHGARFGGTGAVDRPSPGSILWPWRDLENWMHTHRSLYWSQHSRVSFQTRLFVAPSGGSHCRSSIGCEMPCVQQ